MTFWKSKDFKALQNEWYQRLEELGFQDAEQSIGGDLVLKQRSDHPYKGIDQFSREMKEMYFAILAQKVHEAEFRNEVDCLIMTWHAEGANIKSILQELTRLGKTRGRDTIRWTIRKYEMAWGLKTYTPSQLHKK